VAITVEITCQGKILYQAYRWSGCSALGIGFAFPATIHQGDRAFLGAGVCRIRQS